MQSGALNAVSIYRNEIEAHKGERPQSNNVQDPSDNYFYRMLICDKVFHCAHDYLPCNLEVAAQIEERFMSNEKIFISYRRSPGQSDESDARWLRDRLAVEFGRDAVFRDVDDTAKLLARPFMQVLKEQVESCNVCIVVIGPKWIADIGRLHEPNDPVRFEVGMALSRSNVSVLPITVGQVQFPKVEDLPDDLETLVGQGGLSINNTNAESEFLKLVNWLTDSRRTQDPGARSAEDEHLEQTVTFQPSARKPWVSGYALPALGGLAALVAISEFFGFTGIGLAGIIGDLISGEGQQNVNELLEE